MNNKSLRTLGFEAATQNRLHKLASKNVETVNERSWLAENLDYKYNAFGDSYDDAAIIMLEATAGAREDYDLYVAEGKEFAQDNAEQLHDLGVIEAHLGGIAINVEQPISLGQAIKVHKI